MINFCHGILDQAINPNKLNFLFQTSIARKNSIWEVKVGLERVIQFRNLILATSLLAHP